MTAEKPADDGPEECRIRRASGIARKHAAEALSLVEKFTKPEGEPPQDAERGRSERVKRRPLIDDSE